MEHFFNSRPVRFLLILLLLLFVLGAAGNHLTSAPHLWLDEALHVEMARNMAEAGYLNVQSAPGTPSPLPFVFLTSGYALHAPLALAFWLFGFSYTTARLIMVGWMLLFLLVSFALVKRWFGFHAAFWSCAFLATFAPFYGNGKSVIGEIPALTLIFASLWFLNRWLAPSALPERSIKQDTFYALAAGLCLGLGVATKPVFAVAIPAFFFAPFLFRPAPPVRPRFISFFVVGLALPLMVMVLTLTPSGGSIFSFVSYFLSRANQGDFAGNVIANMHHWVYSASLLYPTLLFAAGAAGIWAGRFRLPFSYFRPGVSILFLFALLNALFFLQSVGWYRYVLPFQVIALLLGPAVLFTGCLHWVQKPEARRKMSAFVGVGVLAFLVVAQAVHLTHDADIFVSSKGPAFETLFNDTYREGSVYVVNSFEAASMIPASRRYHFFESGGVTTMPNELKFLAQRPFDYLFLNTDDPSVIPFLADIRYFYTPRETLFGMTLFARTP